MNGVSWTEVDRVLREGPANALRAAGYEEEAYQFMVARPLRCSASALELCHLTVRLVDELRGSPDAQAQKLLSRVSVAAAAAWSGEMKALQRHSKTVEALTARLIPVEAAS